MCCSERSSTRSLHRRVSVASHAAEFCILLSVGAAVVLLRAHVPMALERNAARLRRAETRRADVERRNESCAMEPPPGSLLRPRPPRPKNLPQWGKANLSRILFHHPRLFIPKSGESPDGWVDAVRASQNPENCSRFLLLQNDVTKAGLGMQARFIMQALMLAVRDNRVLLEVESTRPNRSKLWCDRPPYTFECVFEPWSYCAAPDMAQARAAGEVTSPTVRFPYSFWKSESRIATISLDWVRKSQRLWQGTNTWFTGNNWGVVSRVLFRPRPWVRRLSRCTMREYGLVDGRFAALHIRESAEKAAELGKKLPSHATYELLATAMMQQYNLSHLFLQTASERALIEITRWSNVSHHVLGYTHNQRGEHDAWSGWQGGRQMLEATIAGVNMHVASKAVVFLGIQSSMWNFVQLSLLGGGGRPNQANVQCSDSFWKITVATKPDTPLELSGLKDAWPGEGPKCSAKQVSAAKGKAAEAASPLEAGRKRHRPTTEPAHNASSSKKEAAAARRAIAAQLEGGDAPAARALTKGKATKSHRQGAVRAKEE